MTGRRMLFIAFLFFASIVVYHFAKPFVAGKRCMCLAPFAEPKDG